MIASDYPTYEAYCAVKAAQGFQVLPRLLWRVLKENNPNLVERKPLNFPHTT